MSDRITAEKKSALITRQLEIDLRNWIQYEILVSKKLEECLTDDVYSNCLNSCIQRKKSQNERVVENQLPDSEVVEFIDYSTCLSILYSNKSILNSESKEILSKLKQDLDLINPIRNDAIHGRTLLANQYQILEDFCEKISKYDKIFSGTSTEFKNLEEGYARDLDFEFTDIDERNKNNNLPKPEYVDTGFIERKELNAQIKKKIHNNNVISFIGDAGSGKTALALKKCYDYLYDGDFDVILYHSFKTETFSKGEITELQNDIDTSEKFFNKSLEFDKLDKDPIKNLVKYLENNKVLLFLDNLENVLDSNIINFLELFSQADHQSKIFITSRIPINHGDIPIKIGSFSDKEAVDYFQRLCRYLQLKNLQRTLNETQIKNLVNKRKNNPLFIKLSLNAVSENFSLEEAFKEDKDLLNYSYLNIFKTLDEESTDVLAALFVMKKELNSSLLCDLLKKISPEKIKMSLRELTRKNFIISSFKYSETEYYSIRKEVKPFIEKNKFFENDKYKKEIQSQYTKFKAFETQIKINIKDLPENIPENWDSYLCRKESDRRAIFRLKQISNLLSRRVYSGHKVNQLTLDNIIKEHDAEIKKILAELKVTHSDFCEIYRVEAIYEAIKKNSDGVILGFEKAIRLQPNYINLYNYYSDSLSRVDEVEKFLENTKITLEKFPNNLSAKMFRMIAKLWNQQFDQESENLYKQINSSLKSFLPMQYKRKMGMRLLRYNIDKSDFERQNNNFENSFTCMSLAFKKFFDLEKHHLVDQFTTKQLQKAQYSIDRLKNHFRGDEKYKELEKFSDMITDATIRVEQIVSSRSNRVFLNAKDIKGKIFKINVFEEDNRTDNYAIGLVDNKYFLDRNIEKKYLFLPKSLFVKLNLKLEANVSFTLGQRKNRKGYLVFVAENIKII